MGLVRSLILLFGLSLTVPAAFPFQVQRMVLSQVAPKLPVMEGYVDALDTNGQPLAGLVPADFKASLGTTPLKVTAVKLFKDAGEGVAYVFLVDISKSISRADFGSMQSAIKGWIADLGPKDRVSICSFGDDYNVITDFTNDKSELNSAVGDLVQRDMSTHLYQAVSRSMDLERRGDPDLPSRRVLILLSDGKDEGSAITSEDVVQRLAASHIPICVVGYSHLPKSEKRQYLDVLRRFSELSGGVYQEAGNGNIEQVYGNIRDAILRVLVLDLYCPKCAADGRAYPVLVTLSRGGRTLSSSLDVTPIAASGSDAKQQPPPKEQTSPWLKVLFKLRVYLPELGAGLAALLSVGVVVVIKIWKKPPPPPDSSNTIVPTGPTGPTIVHKGIPLTFAVIKGKDSGRFINLRISNKLVIGRSKECDLVIDDMRVSSKHCEMALVNDSLVVYDLSSKNSTIVNGVPIEGRFKLENEDDMLLGETQLRLRFNPDEIPGRR